MKICPKCGRENSNNNRYCDSCGTDLVGNKKKPQNTTSILKKILPVIAGLLAVLLVVEGVSLIEKNDPSRKDSDANDTSMTEVEPNPNLYPESEPESAPEPETEPETVSEEEHILPSSEPDEYHVYQGHTYAFYNCRRYGIGSYKTAADFCREQGGHLAVINSHAENEYLFDLLRGFSSKTAFFGYSDEEVEGDWRWSDGYSEYVNWTTYGDWDLPDNGEAWGGNEDFAEFNYERGKEGIPNDGTWNDARFRENTDLFICEWEYDMVRAKE